MPIKTGVPYRLFLRPDLQKTRVPQGLGSGNPFRWVKCKHALEILRLDLDPYLQKLVHYTAYKHAKEFPIIYIF